MLERRGLGPGPDLWLELLGGLGLQLLLLRLRLLDLLLDLLLRLL